VLVGELRKLNSIPASPLFFLRLLDDLIRPLKHAAWNRQTDLFRRLKALDSISTSVLLVSASRKMSQEALHDPSDRFLVDLPVCAIRRGKPFAEQFRSFARITRMTTKSDIFLHYRLVIPSSIIDVLPCGIPSSVTPG
jgi:hypothetical protein